MIARELTEFFAGFSPNGRPALQRAGDLTFLSNVNACYLARVLGRAPLPGHRLQRGPGLRPRDARGRLGQGLPPRRGGPARPRLRPGRLHAGATSTSTAASARRAATWSRCTRARPAREVRARPALDARAGPAGGPARALGGALGGPPGRPPLRVGARLAGRARCPAACSERCRSSGAAHRSRTAPLGCRAGARSTRSPTAYEDILRLSREGAAPLDDPVPGMSERPMHVAVVIPHFVRGSGGHSTIFTLMARLEELGHTVLDLAVRPARKDVRLGRRRSAGASSRSSPRCARRCTAASTTGPGPTWRSRRAGTPPTPWPCCPAAAPAPTSSRTTSRSSSRPPRSRLWAARTYELGLYGIAASRWLRDLLARALRPARQLVQARRGPRLYRPQPVERRRDTVIFYARDFDPAARRAARRARARGAAAAPARTRASSSSARARSCGCRSPTSCSAWSARRRSLGTTRRPRSGLCLSLTNYSLIPQEMMALRAPVRGPGRGEHRGRDRHAAAAWSSARPTRSRSPTRSRCCSTDRERWEKRSEAGLGYRGDGHRGTRPRSRSRPGCARLCASASFAQAHVKKPDSVRNCDA